MNINTRENKSYSDLIPGYVSEIMNLIFRSGFSAYVAGGAVRDIALGKVPHDYDIATSALPGQTMEIFKGAGIEFYDTGAKHGTVTAVTDEGNVEVTTFREDGGYSDLRRPDEVVFKTTIEDDVRRRDFTVNAMYMDQDGRICDPSGGLNDCANGLIRTVGDPSERFGEDALRILRGIRFASRLGFRIEPDTLRAMEELAGELKSISGERIAVELTGIVTGRYASDAIRTGWKVLSVIIPEIATCHGFDQKSRYHDKDVFEHTLEVIDNIPYEEDKGRDPELAMAALFHDLGKPECFVTGRSGAGHMKGHPIASRAICERVLSGLKFPSKFINDVCLLVRLHDTYVDTDRIEVHKFMSLYPDEIIVKLQSLQRADILAHSELGLKRLDHLEELIRIGGELRSSGAVFDIRDLKIDGNDIIGLGGTEGPEIGKVLNLVFEHYLEEKCPNNREDLLEEAGKILSSELI